MRAISSRFRTVFRRSFSSALPFESDQTARGRVPATIWEKTTKRLLLQPDHPLSTLRTHIEAHLTATHPGVFNVHSALSPVVSTLQCFDDLLVPPEHPSRAESDTYYVTDDTLLRAHMTAHTPDLLRSGETGFLLCGDVYRRDTVDRTHYPVFHQMDAARLFPPGTSRTEVEEDLKETLSGLAKMLFGDAKLRWVDAYFPFTDPSFELEVHWQGDWLELLGCGLLHRGVLDRCRVAGDVEGWAFGIGLERLAMVLFDIPDIRLFWSDDERVLSQFRGKGIDARFKPLSVYPAVEKDLSFWIDGDGFHENDVHETARAICGDLVENVECIDRFEKSGRVSLCFRLRFRSMERSLTHVEVNKLFEEMRKSIAENLPVAVR